MHGHACDHALAQVHGGTAVCRAQARDLRKARFLLRRQAGPQTEISVARIAYNLKTIINVLGELMLINA
jgi:hypothetical protein